MPTTQSEERRAQTRFPVSGLAGSLRFPKDVRLVNLSRGGVAFETDERLAVGKTYVLEVRGDKPAALMAVEVRWCVPDWSTGSHTVYRAGGRLAGLRPRQEGGLWGPLADHLRGSRDPS